MTVELLIQAIAPAVSVWLGVAARERLPRVARIGVALIVVGQLVLFVLSALPYRSGARWLLAGGPLLAGMVLAGVAVIGTLAKPGDGPSHDD